MDSSPGRDRSPCGSLSVLVKLLCSLLLSCKMSPPECSLSSGSTGVINIKLMSAPIAENLNPNESIHHRLEKGIPPRPRWLWPGRRRDTWCLESNCGSIAGYTSAGEDLSYIRGGWAAGEQRVWLSIRHLRELFFIFLLDG